MKKIKKIKPCFLIGYASNLYRIATICHKHSLDDVEFRGVFSTSEMLYDYQREFLEQQFKGKVFDYYGCSEVGTIAYECEHHVKHITDERFIVETTMSENKQIVGRMGEIIITDLYNYVMPFIRYKNGDLCTLSENPCRCGRGLKILDCVEGRAQDFLTSIDGNYIPAIFFPSHFKSLKGMDQYQIIQTEVYNIILKIVKNRMFSQEELDNMIRKIQEMVGNGTKVKVQEEQFIPLTRSGKNRLVISHVPLKLLQH